MLHDHWREYTDKEINQIKKTKCKNCKYSKRFGATGAYKPSNMDIIDNPNPDAKYKMNIGNVFCDYLTMTGKKRGCRLEDCEFYKEGKKYD